MLYPLGRGGMGSVWVGEHTELLSKVAVKFIDPLLAQDASARKRFRIEAQAAASLQSPHVVRVFDYGLDRGEPYIVMELLSGETLAQRLAKERRLTVQDTVEVFQQVGRALEVAHASGIVHRDLKPENIFLVGESDELLVKLLDFGVVKVIREDPRWTELVTQPGNRLGTLFYMSPEQISGEPIDGRADVWSLGILMFECLTGRLPFGDVRGPALISSICNSELSRPSEVADVPPGVDELFESATHPRLSERMSSTREFSAQLEALCQGYSGRCVVRLDDTVRRVVAYSSSGRVSEDELRTELVGTAASSFPALADSDERLITSIPAAINGRRDMDHVALVAELSRRKGILWTSCRVPVGETIHLALLFGSEEIGHMTAAVVETFSAENSDRRPEMWPFELVVRFETPLPKDGAWARSPKSR